MWTMLVIFVIASLWLYHLLEEDDRAVVRRLTHFVFVGVVRALHVVLEWFGDLILLILCFQYWSPRFNLPFHPDYVLLVRLLSSSTWFSPNPNRKFSFLGLFPATTPFQTALRRSNDAELLEHLVHLGASLETVTDDEENAAHVSAGAGCLAGLRFSLQYGVDPNAVDVEGLTPTLKAVKHAPLPSLAATLKILKESGADVSRTGPRGETLMHIAVEDLSTTLHSLDRAKEIVEFGLGHGVSPSVKLVGGSTAGDLAIGRRDELTRQVRRTIETDSRYGVDSRPFLQRYASKYDLLLTLLSENGSGELTPSFTATLKKFVRGKGKSYLSGSSKEDPPSPDLTNECNICLENQSNTALDPCGHCVCHQCANELNICPYCRTVVRKTLKIYR